MDIEINHSDSSVLLDSLENTGPMISILGGSSV